MSQPEPFPKIGSDRQRHPRPRGSRYAKDSARGLLHHHRGHCRILWVTRRALEISRTGTEQVFALLFVFCFGVGPLAGVLAIALHSTGALGKLYSEANENIDMRPVEGVKAAGGSWADQMRWGALPQVIPNVLSYTLLRFEINVRSSSIIGYVGAGGLGQELRTAISLQEYTDLSALFLIIFATVMAIDWLSERLRHRILGLGKPA